MRNVQDQSAITIGNAQEDTYLTDSLYGKMLQLLRHAHASQKVYPTLANGVTLTGGSGAWQLGNKIEIIPASTITDHFDIHYVNPGSASATDTYELVLYSGGVGAEVEIGRCRIIRAAAQSGTAPIPMITELLNPNTRISGAIASSSGGGDTLVISVSYHEY